MFRVDEEQIRFIEVTSKILAMLAALVVAGWTMYTYFNARKAEARTAAIEARKPFESKRLELYLDAASAAATIAKVKDPIRVAQAKDDFWRLYWGPLALVEDRSVEASMVKIGRCLQNDKDCGPGIEQLALDLAHDCKYSIAGQWGASLDEVTFDNLERLRR